MMRALAFLIAALTISAPIAARAECLSSAQAVWRAHPGSWATWRNIDGRKCWMEGERHGNKPAGSGYLHRNHIIVSRYSDHRYASLMPLPRPRLGYPEITPAQGKALWEAINERSALADRLLAYGIARWRAEQ